MQFGSKFASKANQFGSTASNANKNDGDAIFLMASLNIDAIISYQDSNEVFPVSKFLPLATKGVVLTAKTEFTDDLKRF